MQTNTTIQKFTTGNIIIDDAECIPGLTPEEEKYYSIIQGKVRGHGSTGSRSIASNTTGFISMFPEDISEQIGSSASKPTTLMDIKSENNAIPTLTKTLIHSHLCESSFDTDSLEV